MKIKLLLIVALIISLSGCMGYREIDTGYIVSALGVDYSRGEYLLTVEAVAAGDAATKPSTHIFSAAGETPYKARENLEKGLTKALYFDHCAVMMLSKGIEGAAFLEVVDFCHNMRNLNLGVFVLYAQNIKSVLKLPPVTTAVGYDIMGLLKVRLEKKIDYNNKFYQLEKDISEEKTELSLPVVTAGEQGVQISKTVSYKNFHIRRDE